MNFNPDLTPDDDDDLDKYLENALSNNKKETNENIAEIVPVPTNIVEMNVTSIPRLLAITMEHISEDNKTKSELNVISDVLNDNIAKMSIRELIEYYKVLLKRREFHYSCIMKAYEFVNRTELARQYLVGSERKERIEEATDTIRVNKLLEALNIDNEDNLDIEDDED